MATVSVEAEGAGMAAEGQVGAVAGTVAAATREEVVDGEVGEEGTEDKVARVAAMEGEEVEKVEVDSGAVDTVEAEAGSWEVHWAAGSLVVEAMAVGSVEGSVAGWVEALVEGWVEVATVVDLVGLEADAEVVGWGLEGAEWCGTVAMAGQAAKAERKDKGLQARASSAALAGRRAQAAGWVGRYQALGTP